MDLIRCAAPNNVAAEPQPHAYSLTIDDVTGLRGGATSTLTETFTTPIKNGKGLAREPPYY